MDATILNFPYTHKSNYKEIRDLIFDLSLSEPTETVYQYSIQRSIDLNPLYKSVYLLQCSFCTKSLHTKAALIQLRTAISEVSIYSPSGFGNIGSNGNSSDAGGTGSFAWATAFKCSVGLLAGYASGHYTQHFEPGIDMNISNQIGISVDILSSVIDGTLWNWNLNCHLQLGFK